MNWWEQLIIHAFPSILAGLLASQDADTQALAKRVSLDVFTTIKEAYPGDPAFK